MQIHHLKATAKANWGKMQAACGDRSGTRPRRGCQRGQYPYAARGTSLDATLPTWAHAGGTDSLVARLIDPVTRDSLRREIMGTTRRPVARVKAVNDWMKSYAAANKHVYLDYYSAMIDGTGMLKAEFSEDDLHPNAAGYKVMAPLAEAAIAQALR